MWYYEQNGNRIGPVDEATMRQLIADRTISIDTDIHASGGLPDRAREMAPQVPMQRPGSAEEVARSILWLMSPESSYTTGTVLDVTGGR